MRGLPVLLSISMAVLWLPAGAASESVTESYLTGTPVVLGVGFTLVIEELDLDDDGEDDSPNIGGVSYVPARNYVNAVVSISDDIFGSDGAFRACFWSHDGGTIQETYCTEVGCGTRMLLASPFEAGRLKTTMHGLAVTEALAVCGSSAGTTTADFF